MQRCLVANRGEIAIRIIQACHELGMEAVAVYSTVDAEAAHVARADRAFPLGGATSADSYLRIQRLIEIALEAGCDCLHPGYGFLSEEPEFARAVQEAGLTWVGPHSEAMRIMAVKTDALATLAGTGIPTLPRYIPDSEVALRKYRAEAERIGYPLLVKSASGGGGRGIRMVRQVEDLEEALVVAQREAKRSFGDGRLYLERNLEGARHVEVQIAADLQGNYRHLYERDCSLQRRRQKIVEEAPAFGISAEQRQEICTAAITVAQAVQYDNLGTVEFLLTDTGEFFFLEMNTRLQVEHPVTEMICGVDLVTLQFRLAGGEAMPFAQDDIQTRGHAIQCRVYAEAPAESFRPDTGTVTQLFIPNGAGIRWDSAISKGDEVSPHYDSLLGKLVVHDETRSAAIHKMAEALKQVAILGVETNVNLLQDLLKRHEVQEGGVDTGFVERILMELLEQEECQLPAEVLLAAQLSEATPVMKKDGAGRKGPWEVADRFRIGKSNYDC